MLALFAEPFTQSAGALGLSSATLGYEGEPVTEAELEDRLESDIDRGVTGAGPHLHDVRSKRAAETFACSARKESSGSRFSPS